MCELTEEGRPNPAATTAPSSRKIGSLFDVAIHGTEGQSLGQFCVRGGASRELSKEERDMLSTGASLADLAVKQRRLYEQLNYYSTHDQLTALANRRLSDIHLEDAIHTAAKDGRRLGVVYIDVDQFKQVNDRFGHKTGDLYLQEIAERMRKMVRTDDLLARIGGDEFLVTATAMSSVEDAVSYGLRLQSCFNEVFSLEGIELRGAASIGMAIYPDHGKTACELQRYADIEMYSAKQRGRPGVGRRDVGDSIGLAS